MSIHYLGHYNNHKGMDVLAKCKTLTLECTYNNVETLPENNLAQRINKLRLLNNLTIKKLSSIAKISEETISNIEKEKVSNPNIITINKLSKALNTTNEYLLGANNWPENTPAQIIYKYRMIAGLSQRQLAKLCKLHQSTIKDYENGIISNQNTLKKIYKILSFSHQNINT